MEEIDEIYGQAYNLGFDEAEIAPIIEAGFSGLLIEILGL